MSNNTLFGIALFIGGIFLLAKKKAQADSDPAQTPDISQRSIERDPYQDGFAGSPAGVMPAATFLSYSDPPGTTSVSEPTAFNPGSSEMPF